MQAKLWPTGLIGRVGIVLFAAVVLELLGSTYVFEQAELISSDDMQASHVAEQLETASRVLSVTDPVNRPAVASTLSDTDLGLVWTQAAGELALPASDRRTRKLRDKLLATKPSLAERHLALQPVPGDPDTTAKGSVQLADGSALHFRITGLGGVIPSLYGQLGSMAVLSLCVLLAALLIVRTLAAPLRMLVRATDAIGHGPPIHLDDSQGPREIRGVASAFNAMQARISKLLSDRTEALAAVSHDLRTPIARMKLRADLSDNGEDRTAFTSDLTEMEAMLDDLLAYLRGETDHEKPRRTDLAAMLQTLVDDVTDAGRDATYTGPDNLAINVRALAMKRAVSNVINNAIAYGDRAGVSLHVAGDTIVVAIEDDGPGIPDAERETVFTPFFRGDASRNRAKGGMGLGLAIARQAVWREGGPIELENRAAGGLRVTITVPAARTGLRRLDAVERTDDSLRG